MGYDDANSSHLRQDVPLMGFTYRSNETSCLIAGDILACWITVICFKS